MSPTPIDTAPADTARAMHDSEMRGHDMQDDQDCTGCEGSGITHQTERYCTCGAGMELARYAAVDKQDAPERLWVAGTPQECGQYFPSCVEAEGAWGGVGVEYTRTDLCITEAECQRRIDAAVQAERDACAAWHEAQAWNDLAQAKTYRDDGLFDGSIEACMSDALLHRESAAAIRARGQK